MGFWFPAFAFRGGLEIRVQALCMLLFFFVYGLCFGPLFVKVSSLGSWVQGLGLRVSGKGFKALG